MSGKRSASASQGTPAKEEPPAKKPFVTIPPVNIGPVATEVCLRIFCSLMRIRYFSSSEAPTFQDILGLAYQNKADRNIDIKT